MSHVKVAFSPGTRFGEIFVYVYVVALLRCGGARRNFITLQQ